MRGSNSASTSLAPDRFDDADQIRPREEAASPPPVRVVLYEYDGFWATLTAHVAQSWKSGSFLGRRVVLLTQNIDRRRSKGSGYVARVVKDGRWAGHGPSRLRNEFIPSQSYLDSDVDEDFTYEHKIVYFLESDSDSDISDASLGFDFSDESDDTRSTAVSEEDKFCNDSGSFDSPMRPATPTPYDNDSDDDDYSPALETSTMEVDEINGLFRDDDLMDYDVLDPQLIYGDGARF
ncbi:hypothetical protein DFH11DRAFT_1825731 [Phellopilus nigrolimitatus]|nr:hypothetical protein DFH11DRAFT_1825731 [Phellopilus nigrolimitatus]